MSVTSCTMIERREGGREGERVSEREREREREREGGREGGGRESEIEENNFYYKPYLLLQM